MESMAQDEAIAPGERGLYLHCLARPESLAGLEGGGVDEDSALFVEAHGRVAAVLSEVRLADFSGPEAEKNLQTLEWLTPRVLRHEDVIQRVLERSPVLPVGFATIFASRERVSRLLAAHHDAISGFLDSTAGTEEWGVKVYLDRDTAMRRLVDESRAAAETDPSVSPGRRYMEERRIRAEADGRLQRWIDESCACLLETLSRHARDSVERHVFAAGTPGEMVANWAFLVAREDVERLRMAVSETSAPLEPRGLALECTGPFPPYSFTPALADPDG